jgi:hypothetical protein
MKKDNESKSKKDKDNKSKNKHRYFAKRKVSNKGSERRPHIISAFYSNKMQEVVRFESSRENLIGKIVELSTIVDEYYTQPVEVPIMVYNSQGDLTQWMHVPDLLVYCNERPPYLYQIKSKQAGLRPKKNIEHINQSCHDYAQENDWEYKVIYPDELDATLRKNIDLLFSFRNSANEKVSNTIKAVLNVAGALSIELLVKECQVKAEEINVLPVIYYELAIGNLYTDLYKPITLSSIVRIRQESDYDLYDYVLELKNYAKDDADEPGRILC